MTSPQDIRREIRWSSATTALAGVVVIVALSGLLTHIGPVVALGVGPGVLFAVRRRLRPVFLSPPWVMVLILTGTGLLGYISSGQLAGVGGGGIRLNVNEELTERTTYLFAGLASAIALGAAGITARHSLQGGRAAIPSPDHTTRTLFLAGSAIPALAFLINLGGELFEREAHLAGVGETNVLNAVQSLGVAAVALLGYLAGAERGPRRWAAASLAVFYLGIFFSLSSRRLSLVPLLFAVGLALAVRHRKRFILLIGSALTVAALPLPLYLRSEFHHGLWPYLDALGEFSYRDVNWLEALNNVLLAFPITAYTAFVEPRLPADWLFIELNPLPGSIAGWYDISPYMGLNSSTPYSSVGELGNYGWWAVAAVGVGLGALLAYFDNRVAAYIRRGLPFFGVGIVAMSVFASVTALQYSTRTFTRLLLYLLIIELVAHLWLRNRDEAQPSVGETVNSREPWLWSRR